MAHDQDPSRACSITKSLATFDNVSLALGSEEGDLLCRRAEPGPKTKTLYVILLDAKGVIAEV